MYCAETIMMTRSTSTTSTIGVTLMPTMPPWPPPDFPPSVPAMMPSDPSVELVQGGAGFRCRDVSGHGTGFRLGPLAESVHLDGELVLRLQKREELLAQDA